MGLTKVKIKEASILRYSFNTFAQSESENMLKYWHYRNRLKYFVVPGAKQGESEIIGIRNNMKDNYLKFIAS